MNTTTLASMIWNQRRCQMYGSSRPLEQTSASVSSVAGGQGGHAGSRSGGAAGLGAGGVAGESALDRFFFPLPRPINTA